MNNFENSPAFLSTQGTDETPELPKQNVNYVCHLLICFHAMWSCLQSLIESKFKTKSPRSKQSTFSFIHTLLSGMLGLLLYFPV